MAYPPNFRLLTLANENIILIQDFSMGNVSLPLYALRNSRNSFDEIGSTNGRLYFVSFFQALNFSIVSFMLNFLSFPAPKKEQCCLSFKKERCFLLLVKVFRKYTLVIMLPAQKRSFTSKSRQNSCIV